MALKRPAYSLTAISITLIFATTFLYFDEFLFLAPYLTFYIPPEGIGTVVLDLAVSSLSGIAIALSFFQLRNMPRIGKKKAKVGLVGIVAALLAGACPCYYLVPLLAVAGGAGGALAGVGIFFNAYQLPIKLLSLMLLASVTYSLERSLRSSCDIPGREQDISFSGGRASTLAAPHEISVVLLIPRFMSYHDQQNDPWLRR